MAMYKKYIVVPTLYDTHDVIHVCRKHVYGSGGLVNSNTHFKIDGFVLELCCCKSSTHSVCPTYMMYCWN